jgi:hypothetical protein
VPASQSPGSGSVVKVACIAGTGVCEVGGSDGAYRVIECSGNRRLYQEGGLDLTGDVF